MIYEYPYPAGRSKPRNTRAGLVKSTLRIPHIAYMNLYGQIEPMNSTPRRLLPKDDITVAEPSRSQPIRTAKRVAVAVACERCRKHKDEMQRPLRESQEIFNRLSASVGPSLADNASSVLQSVKHHKHTDRRVGQIGRAHV